MQLLKETRVPIPAMNEHGQCVDYEYERNGTASIFMFAEPLLGFRQATARTRQIKQDWAIEVAQLAPGCFRNSRRRWPTGPMFGCWPLMRAWTSC